MRILGRPSAARDIVERNLAALKPHARFAGEMLPALWQAGLHYAVDPVGVVAQAYKETGGGNYSGQMQPGFFNTCGLKNRASLFAGVDDGDRPLAHARFATWEAGAAAHVQHLRAYAGAPVQDVVVDPRYVWVIGKHRIEHWSELGGKWAQSATYGTEVEDIMRRLSVA